MLGRPLLNNSSNQPNLVNQLPRQARELPPGFYQELFLNFLSLLSAGGFGYVFKLYLENTVTWPFVAGALLPVLVFSAFELIFVQNILRRMGIIALQIALMCEIGGGHLGLTSLLWLGGIMWIVMVVGEIEARREAKNSIEFRFFRITRYSLRKIITASILFMVVAYLPFSNVNNDLIPRDQFATFFDWASGLAQNAYPDVQFTSTIQAFAESVARIQLQKDTRFRQLFPATQEQTIKQSAPQVIQSLSQMLGITINPSETLMTAFYSYFQTLIAKFQATTQGTFPIYLGVVLFLIVRGFGTIFYFAAAGITYFFYQILLAINVAHVVGENRTKEIIEFS